MVIDGILSRHGVWISLILDKSVITYLRNDESERLQVYRLRDEYFIGFSRINITPFDKSLPIRQSKETSDNTSGEYITCGITHIFVYRGRAVSFKFN